MAEQVEHLMLLTGHAKLVGVLNGFFFIDSTTKKPTFANNVAASQAFGTNPNTGSTNGFAFVNTRSVPRIHHCKADAAIAVAANKTKLRLIVTITDGSNKDGQSVVTTRDRLEQCSNNQCLL